MEIQKLAAADAAGAPTNTFFIALGRQRLPTGRGRRPRRRAAPRRREPGHAHRHDAQRAARHVLAGRQDQQRARARRPARHGERARRPHRRAGLLRRLGRLRRLPGPRRRDGRRADQRPHARWTTSTPARCSHPATSGSTATQALAFSRNRHDFPNSDITAHRQPGPADPRPRWRSCNGKRTARSASSRPRRSSAATRSSTAWASPTSTGSAGSPSS